MMKIQIVRGRMSPKVVKCQTRILTIRFDAIATETRKKMA